MRLCLEICTGKIKETSYAIPQVSSSQHLFPDLGDGLVGQSQEEVDQKIQRFCGASDCARGTIGPTQYGRFYVLVAKMAPVWLLIRL